MTYEIDIAGMKRQLPLCPVTDDLYIGAFVMFGDVELTVHAAAETAAKRRPVSCRSISVTRLHRAMALRSSTPERYPR